MDKVKEFTLFAPAERASEDVLKTQIKTIKDISILRVILDAVPLPFVILNSNRQIVFTNKSFMNFIKNIDEEAIYGLRFGEAMSCGRSTLMPGGCGTSEYCTVCGAVNAILKAQDGDKDTQECLISKENGEALELKVWTEPFNVQDHNFTLVAVADISNEKRRRFLERIFFHDILNDAGCLRGYSELLHDSEPVEMAEYADVIYNMSDSMIEDIISQQELSAAENDELKTMVEEFEILPLINEIIQNYKKHSVAENKTLKISEDSKNHLITTDRKSARRVVGNLIKNALEAVKEGEKVEVFCKQDNDFTIINVANTGVIPRPIQLQIFQRSFSTKGQGRGLGTYSIKLFTEKYLHGQISFTSTNENGTVFELKIPKQPLKINDQTTMG